VKFRKLYSLNPSHLTKFSNSEGRGPRCGSLIPRFHQLPFLACAKRLSSIRTEH
jgi:hypothetical protein